MEFEKFQKLGRLEAYIKIYKIMDYFIGKMIFIQGLLL
jgi:hypothetical protein